MTDALDLLERALATFSGDGPSELPADVQDWLRQGLAAYVEGRGADIGVALGLGNGCWKKYLLRQRNRAIVDAYRWVDDVAELSSAIKRFRAGKWQRCSELSEDADDLEVCLYRAFSTGEKVPDSIKQLRRIVIRDNTGVGYCPDLYLWLYRAIEVED